MGEKKAEVFTIATAHLDTSWLWTLETTIKEYLPDTVKRNFAFFEKFPEYKFNFEGSYRYELIKEYDPEAFEKIRRYVNEGRWHPCGSCYENGDVNIPSPEAMTRNILYGNGFFEREFGVKSNDIFLPDCFGFGRALPTVAAHSGLTGFSTGKLFWGSSVPIPFDTGRWTGPDGNGVWAALMPFSYTTVFKKIEKAKRVRGKLEDNAKKGLPSYTFAYHGTGDRGGAPHKTSVRNVITSQRNNKNADIKVYSATTKEFFDKIEFASDAEKARFPVYDGEFLLTAHGAGSYTSRTVTKRWNRRCELLADAAERFACAAYINGFAEYPQNSFDTAWKKVIAHHFHDDITGTSFEECYKRNHNDYVQALHTFSSEYTAACEALARHLDTSFVTGIPVVVANPLQCCDSRMQAVKVRVNSKSEHFRVFDSNGEEVPSQTKNISETEKEVTFVAKVDSCSLTVFDVRASTQCCESDTGLCIRENGIENKYLTVTIDKNGDICSIFDKRLQRELLRKPIRLGIYNDVHSFDWPSWEVKYEDLCQPPYMYAADPVIRIKEQGPALCALEIVSTAGRSTFTQTVSLDCESEYVSVQNETDWREEASFLKAEFPFRAANEKAAYDIGIGAVERGTNTKNLYEVPAQKWADITDASGEFGVCVCSDSRSGWDKPDQNTLRLTLVHTPMASYRWECSQHVMDMGLNRYSYAVMGHKGNCADMTSFADRFCQPMHTFVTEKHEGNLQSAYSFATVDNDNVRISAVKKAQDSDRIIFRVCECAGADQQDVTARFARPVVQAYEVWGDETEKGRIELTDGELHFDIGHNAMRSFALVFDAAETEDTQQKQIDLPFNATGITEDKNRADATLNGGVSIPTELVSDTLLFAGVQYRFSREKSNCLVCDGSELVVGEGFDRVHLLVTSLTKDRTAVFASADKTTAVTVQDCFEPLGYWDLMMLRETGYIKPHPQAVTFSHTHNKNGNMIAKQFYVFHCEIPLNGADRIKLPDDKNIVIFAATATKKTPSFCKGDSHFDTLSKRTFDYEFSDYAKKRMQPAALERFFDLFINRVFSAYLRAGEESTRLSFGELYYIIRKLSDSINNKKRVKALTDKRK